MREFHNFEKIQIRLSQADLHYRLGNWNFQMAITYSNFVQTGHMRCFFDIYKLVDLKYHFVGESFELEIWHRCYQHKYDFMKKISWQKRKFSIFGRVAKLATVKFSTSW